MSNRQKSFFDQNHGSKTRPHWQRNKSTTDIPHNRNVSPKEPMTAPQVPLSTQTKSKLKSFEFSAPKDAPNLSCPAEDSADKENSMELGDSRAEDASEVSETTTTLFPSTQESAKKPPTDCPRTPAGRLPLADLIGPNGEELPPRDPAQEVSPERVDWKYSRSPDSSARGNSFTTPGPFVRKAKKRARSSSPTASPHEPQVLKTPQADPATDLWNRVTMNTADLTGAKAPPDFARLMNGSSPHSPGIGASPGSGLRRSLSCGTEWPTSNAKRRRTTAPSNANDADDIFFAPCQLTQETPAKSKLSRVNLLVDRLQESLSKPARMRERKGPSSSSPLPARNDHHMLDYSSPLKAANESSMGSEPVEMEDADEALPRPMEGSDEVMDDVGKLTAKDSSSDFGDFDDADIDIDMLEAVESAAAAASAAPVQNSSGPKFHQAAGTTLPDSTASGSPLTNSAYGATGQHMHQTLPVPAENATATKPTRLDDYDEFDDGDDEMFAADLEEIVAKYDTQQSKSSTQLATMEGVQKKPDQALPQSMAGNGEPRTGDGSEDEFGDFDDADFDSLEPSCATYPQAMKDAALSQASSSRKSKVIKRYLTKNVVLGEYELSPGQIRPEKVLQVEDERTRLVKVIILRQSWFDTPCTPGSFIHLIGDFGPNGQCIIDDGHNMLILHPDHLISSTVVADSFSCTRRAVLQDRVKATGESSKPLVFGHILHEIFQEALMANKWDSKSLEEIIERVVLRHMEDIYTIQMEAIDAISYLKSKMPELQVWAELFIAPTPRNKAIINDRNGSGATLCLNKLLDVEEHVWSPMYGLKGNIDASVQVTMKQGTEEKTLTVPFELKTGKNTRNAMHRAQTALYTLLLSDRYDVEIAYGILYYMETSETHRIHAIRHELRHMVMQRNEMACYVRDRLQLPPMLKSSHMCGNCYAQTPCFIYHKLVDDGTGETSGLKDKFDKVVRHLKPKHKAFFVHWDDLLTKEEKDMLKFRRELWTMTSSERQKLGRCFGDVIIEPGSFYEAREGSKINRYQYTFIKKTPSPSFSFLQSQITIGEPIVISDEEGHFALANGYVTHVHKRRIIVAIDRRLHNARVRRSGFHAQDNQVFAGIMEVTADGQLPATPLPTQPTIDVLYRIDKDEFSNGMATARNNIIHIMSEGPFGAREIRELVVDGKPPTFKPTSTAYTLSSQAELNVDQKNAIEKVMSAQNCALVQGMPGTGKTTTVAHIIRALVSQGKSVLLTSYTHTAVDNILLKILHDGFGILRLGAVAKVHPEVQEHVILAAIPRATTEEVREAYHSPKVVATTCLGINHPIFNERVFDYCIVDEASQLTLPVCLGPIRMAKTFILVGDHQQLPPLVRNEEAREGGLDKSLFLLLSDMYPDAVVKLTHQYRMCEDIMLFSNTLIYDGALRCGTKEVAQRSLRIPNMDALKLHHHTSIPKNSSLPPTICVGPRHGSCWIRDMLDPSVKACFINTDPLLPVSREQTSGSRIINPTEVAVCKQLVDSLLTTGVSPMDIGVISVYRSQLALLRHTMRDCPLVEMHTADKFQGRDKEVVILSLVRSNEQKNVGDLLKDWRRINVSLTRARTKLLVIGSRETLKGNELLGSFLQLMEEKCWDFEIPKGALEMHHFEEGGSPSQVTASAGSVGGAGNAAIAPAIPRVLTDKNKETVSPAKVKRVEKGKVVKSVVPGKTGKIGERAILKNRPVLRDILNDMM